MLQSTGSVSESVIVAEPGVEFKWYWSIVELKTLETLDYKIKLHFSFLTWLTDNELIMKHFICRLSHEVWLEYNVVTISV